MNTLNDVQSKPDGVRAEDDLDEEYERHRRQMIMAEERLSYLETMLRHVSSDRRHRARQRHLTRAIKQQQQEVDALRTVVRRMENRRKDLATRYINVNATGNKTQTPRKQPAQIHVNRQQKGRAS